LDDVWHHPFCWTGLFSPIAPAHGSGSVPEALMSAQPGDNSFLDLAPSTAALTRSALQSAQATGTTWQRSSRCATNGSCVEVASLASGEIGVRDGKIGAASPVLAFGPESWRGFISGIATGRFDLGG
jgi:hypothetical protein